MDKPKQQPSPPHQLPPPSTQFACIGAGISSLALAALLRLRHNLTSITLFEKSPDLGGTWLANRYPGAACDIPSALYSFSFFPNPDWSSPLPPAAEIHAYLHRVASKYELHNKITYHAEVKAAVWDEGRQRWRLTVVDVRSGEELCTTGFECQFLFAGGGVLVEPKGFDKVAGLNEFKGRVVHSARWPVDQDIVTDKRLVVFGNGCTAAQLVPAAAAAGCASITQVVRSAQWIVPPLSDTPGFSSLRNLPGKIQRAIISGVGESAFISMRNGRVGQYLRAKRARESDEYIRRMAPERYHGLLVPDYEFGCKRRIYDPGYLASLHRENVDLLESEQVDAVVPEGLRLKSGEVLSADIIVLATGFQTNTFLPGVQVVGQNGVELHERWAQDGGPGAYDCTAVSGFPNFFMLAGPNSITGHTSVIMAVENTIGLTLRIIKPVLAGAASSVQVRREAEAAWTRNIQRDLATKTVWAPGCSAWYIREEGDGQDVPRWNAMLYPYWQVYYWWRCRFPTRGDWVYA